jgi:Ca2+-transporting ATPase
MARKNALIERLSAVQTLGSTTVILTDKTGTLTENRMHVDRVFLASGEVTFDRTNQIFHAGGQTLKPIPGTALATLLRAVALCNNATIASGDHPASGDPMEVALLEVASAGGLSRPALLAALPEVKEVAFDVQTRMMATVHRHDGEFLVAVKGAPETIFDCATRVLDDAGLQAFGRKQRQRWHEAAEVLAGQGLRLLAVAEKTVGDAETAPYEELVLIGLVGFQDPPRADIASAIADARRAGIRTVMVTGDHTATARHISRVVGLASEDQVAISGRDLKSVGDMSLQEREQVRRAQVFSRVTPEQKLDLIRLHQQAGDVVAMTGDGVNDAPALRKADIGIAMGLRGTQVAHEAADMVLRDDAFSTIIDAIREGRIILTNIRRFTTYLLSCNLSEILIVALAVIGGLPLPLLPLQILFLNLVTDVFPALALGTVKGDDSVLERPPRPPDEPILARRQWQTIIFDGMSIALSTLAALVSATFVLSLDDSDVTTVTFFTLALAQLWHVFNMRNWRERLIANPVTQNAYVWLAVVVCLLILALAYLQPDLAGVLKLTSLSGGAWLVVLGCSFIPVAIRQVQAWWRQLAGSSPRHESADR